MDFERSSKVQRLTGIDRISELPDPILCEILRLLPTKNALATSILSTRWKDLFPIWSPPTPVTLDMDDSVLLHPARCVHGPFFVNFVDKLFYRILHHVHRLETMTLKCQKNYGDEKLMSWVYAASRRSVRELRLRCFLDDVLPLFNSLKECTILTLELNGTFNFRFSDSHNNIMPTKLKTLNLCNIVFGYDDFSASYGDGCLMMTLSMCCPELEELSFIDYDMQSLGPDILIKFPRLKTLIVRNSMRPSCKVTIEAPDLKTLDLYNVTFDVEEDFQVEVDENGDESSVDRWESLIKCFPKLEELSLTNCHWKGVQDLVTESRLLRSLIIRNSLSASSCLTFNTPNLQLLLLNDRITKYTFIRPFNSLQSTHIDVGRSENQLSMICKRNGDEEPWYYKHVRGLIRYCSDTRDLHISTRSIEILCHVPVDLPVFQNLVSLKLGCLCRSGWKVLARLLCSAPYLEKLVFEKGFEESEGGYAEFESVVSAPPICLKFNLKEIDFLEFNDVTDGFKLIEYFLKNGEVMQRLKLQCRPIKNSSSLNTLFNLSMKSKIVIALACWKDERLLKEIGSDRV